MSPMPKIILLKREEKIFINVNTQTFNVFVIFFGMNM